MTYLVVVLQDRQRSIEMSLCHLVGRSSKYAKRLGNATYRHTRYEEHYNKSYKHQHKHHSRKDVCRHKYQHTRNDDSHRPLRSLQRRVEHDTLPTVNIERHIARLAVNHIMCQFVVNICISMLCLIDHISCKHTECLGVNNILTRAANNETVRTHLFVDFIYFQPTVGLRLLFYLDQLLREPFQRDIGTEGSHQNTILSVNRMGIGTHHGAAALRIVIRVGPVALIPLHGIYIPVALQIVVILRTNL